MLKGKGAQHPSIRQRLFGPFTEAGIDRERIILLDFAGRIEDHLRLYNQVDVALDSFPYNGTTTTCEALAMGVPVITRVWPDRHAGRVGASLLTQTGLTDWIAWDDETFIERAGALIQQHETLKHWRGALPRRMTTGRLGDGGDLAATLEDAFETVWQRWQAGVPAGALTPES
jgi:predicted O-linked N-acetylglucosamine transferase (SPINDLY family)